MLSQEHASYKVLRGKEGRRSGRRGRPEGSANHPVRKIQWTPPEKGMHLVKQPLQHSQSSAFYPVRPQDSPQKWRETKQQVRPSTQLLIPFPPFSVGHSKTGPGMMSGHSAKQGAESQRQRLAAKPNEKRRRGGDFPSFFRPSFSDATDEDRAPGKAKQEDRSGGRLGARGRRAAIYAKRRRRRTSGHSL